MAERKSIKLEALREVLGEEAFKAVMTQVLRRDVQKVAAWYPEDIENTRQYMDRAETKNGGVRTAQRHAFTRLAYKFISENPTMDRKFREFIDVLENRNLTEGGFTCDVGTCRATYKTAAALQTHKTWHGRDRRPKACPVCGKESGNVGTHIAQTGDPEHMKYREEHRELVAV